MYFYWTQIEKWDPVFWDEEEEDPNVSYAKEDDPEDDNKPLFPKDPRDPQGSVRKDRDMFGTETPDMTEEEGTESKTSTKKKVDENFVDENIVDEKVTNYLDCFKRIDR